MLAVASPISCRQVGVLCQVPCLKHDETIATVSVLEGLPKEDCRNKQNRCRAKGEVALSTLAQLQYLRQNYDKITNRLDRNYAHLGGELREFSVKTGIPVALRGHSRLQPIVTLEEPEPEEKTYRSIMSGASLWHFRSLLTLTLYLRLEGIYAETVPTMHLSAAHSAEDVERVARAIKKSLLQMRKDGLLVS